MKRLLIIAILFSLFSNLVVGQEKFDVLYSKFGDNEQFFHSELSKKTIKLYLKNKKPNKEMYEALNKISYIKVLSFLTKDRNDITMFMSLIDSHFDLKNYNPFKINVEGINRQMVYLKQDDEIISDLLVINTSASLISVVEIIGDINLEKISTLKSVLNIKSLESLNDINNTTIDIKTKKNIAKSTPYNYGLLTSPIDKNNTSGSIKIYNKDGNKIMARQNNPLLLVNGYQSNIDFKSTLSGINANCVQSINIIKEDDNLYPNGQIDVMLKGDQSEIYTVCEGKLYFGQNGYLQTINIDDDCSPYLLIDCNKKPLSEIHQLEPHKFKSIELTANPRNCEGPLEGEYIVVESK